MEYGCIGKKLGHSFSRQIHAQLADYDYTLREIPEEELDAFMRRADFKAINVTIPYKQAVIPYLDEISETARRIGAVNTVVNRGGRLYGYNTDFIGMTALIRRQGVSLEGKKVLVLGSGGTSKTAAAAAESLGAAQVLRVSRSGRDGAVSYDTVYREHTDAQALINTTPCGMFPQIGTAAAPLDRFPRLTSVTDAVYNPLRPALVVQALERGIPAAGGLYMLVAQAAAAAERFIGRAAAEEEIERIYRGLLREKRTAVLIGMPGCGKSTLGRRLAERLQLRFFDPDEEIARQEGRPAAELIRGRGEAEFRRIETEVIRRLAAEQGAVIATGGGAVLSRENVSLLRENGTLLWIDRPVEALAVSQDRPLSSSRELLRQRYRERHALYEAAADAVISAVPSIETNLRALEDALERCGEPHGYTGGERI